jgi:predicted deacylase
MSQANDVNPAHFRSVSYSGRKPGPRFIVTGAVHGNETCGTQGIARVMAELDSGLLDIVAGSVSFVPVTNPLAYARGQRMGDRNLNRNLYPIATPQDFEDHIANWLCPLLAHHDVLLDLHSFQSGTQAFAMVGPLDNEGTLQPFRHAQAEQAMALHLGVGRFVDGWLDTYAIGVERRLAETRAKGLPLDTLNNDARYGVGTTEYMRSTGGYAITLECGQHLDAAAPQVAYEAIRNTMALLGLTATPVPPPTAQTEALSIYDVIDKNHPEDSFSRPWISFDRLAEGDLIATRHDGTKMIAECDGFIVFPNARSEPGHEWYYLAKANHRFDPA